MRRALDELLHNVEGRTVSELSECVDVPLRTLSYRLKQLRDGGFVTVTYEQQGRKRFSRYHLTSKGRRYLQVGPRTLDLNYVPSGRKGWTPTSSPDTSETDDHLQHSHIDTLEVSIDHLSLTDTPETKQQSLTVDDSTNSGCVDTGIQLSSVGDVAHRRAKDAPTYKTEEESPTSIPSADCESINWTPELSEFIDGLREKYLHRHS